MANGVGITEGVGKVLASLEKVWSWGTQHQQVVAIGDETTTNIAVVDAGKALKVNFAGASTAIKNGSINVPVSAAATLINGSPLANRRAVVLFNESDTTIRVGTSAAVTTVGANLGLPIPSGQSLSLDLSDAVALYAVHAGAATKLLTYLEIA
jgi:hypothetical protein